MQPLTAAAHLTVNNTNHLVTLFRIARVDGTILRFSSSDRAIEFEGFSYSPGAAPPTSHAANRGSTQASNAERASELEAGTLDIRTAISSAGITLEDLHSNKYIDAVITEYVVDGRFPWLGAISTQVFAVESMTWDRETAVANLSTTARKLQDKQGGLYTRNCRHKLGENDGTVGCFFTVVEDTITVSAVTSRAAFRCTNGVTRATGWSSFGYLEWLTGDNAGDVCNVKQDTQFSGSTHDLILELPTHFDIQVGDTAKLAPGCDLRVSTCETKFSQLANFGGFPDVPGNDEIFLTPDRK
jgi:uncharacterized phage protein (TIGR02218 family)